MLIQSYAILSILNFGTNEHKQRPMKVYHCLKVDVISLYEVL